MSKLAELRARNKAKQEKKSGSLETGLTELTKDPSVSFVSSVPRNTEFFSQSDTTAVNVPEPAQDHVPSTPEAPVKASLAVTELLPTRIEPPAPTDRLCYQCASFQRSPYGYPLGLCLQHSNRIQHTTSQPTQFGCGEFVLREPVDDTRTCLLCRHYNPLSTICSVVNTGCPYPSIPPCSGEKFQHKLKAVNTNKAQKETQS